jgi:hypothetical protein
VQIPRSSYAALIALALTACVGPAPSVDALGPADGSQEVGQHDLLRVDTLSPPTCSDGLKNGVETAIDCGGGCPGCDNGKRCAVATDCASGYCNPNGICNPLPPACTDSLRNGDETDIDCGGGCPKCKDSKHCAKAADCLSGYCDPAKLCKPKPPSCTDGLKNGLETDIDCGGGCPKCTNGKHCAKAADCLSAYCDASSTCRAKPSCGGGSVYDCVVLADKPISYYQYISVHTLYDVVSQRNGTTVGPVGAKAFTGFPAGPKNNAPNFTTASYISIPDHSAFSINTSGTLTLEFWLRPTTLKYSFPASTPDSGKYVYALGKGDWNDYEYGIRFYSSDAVPKRANAISGYVWNTTGGLGSGATSIKGLSSTSAWTHFVVTYTNFGPYGPSTSYNNYNAKAYPGTIKLWRNGVLESSGYMSQFGVSPKNASSPLQLGRRGSSDSAITFAGAVGKLALYNKALSTAQIVTHYKTAYLK